MAKHNFIVIFVLAVITAIFFSGCSSPYSGSSNWGGNTTSTTPGITTGIHSSDPRTNGRADYGTPPSPSQTLDDRVLFSYINGLKIGYDASADYANYAQTLSTATYSEQLLADLLEAISLSGYDNFDVATFLSFHPNMELDSTKVYRAIWILNLIDQYQLLSSAILSDIIGNYGSGYLQNTQLSSTFYPLVDLGDSISPTAENLGVMDISVTATTDNLVLANPNYVDSSDPQYSLCPYVYRDYQNITVDLTNQNITIGASQYPITAPSVVTTAFTSWELNNLNNAKDYWEAQNSFSFTNPVYDALITDISDIASHQTLYVNATISNGTISYQLSLEAPTISASSISEYLNDFIGQNSLYLAYKILESVCNIPVAERFVGTPNQIEICDFLSLIPTYISLGGRIGLVEKDFVLEAGDLSLTEKIVSILEDNFVGFTDASLSSAFEGFVNNRVNQYVVVFQNDAVCALPTDSQAQKLFVDSYNIEYIDISLDKLCESPDDAFLSDYGNIVNVLVMVNPQLENTMYFEFMSLAFSALNYDVDLTTYFRYVQGGIEKIFANIDYATANALDEDFQSSFEGHIPVLNGEITMGYADSTTLNISKENAPNSNIFYNHEMLFDGFVNNNPSEFLQAVNVKNNSVYAYDADKNCYYYSENSTDCDYIELSLNANSSGAISYAFMYIFCCMEDKTP